MTEPSTRKAPGKAAQLRRLGFQDAVRAEQLSNDPMLVQLASTHVTPAEDIPGVAPNPVSTPLLQDLAATADPDRALLALVRIASAAQEEAATSAQLHAVFGSPLARGRLFAILAASSAFGDELVRHPAMVAVLNEAHDLPGDAQPPTSRYRSALLTAVGANPDGATPVARNAGTDTIDDLRIA